METELRSEYIGYRRVGRVGHICRTMRGGVLDKETFRKGLG